MQTARQAFDTARADAFAENLLDTLNRGALCLMVSVGHRTRLFDTMSRLAWVTSGELARKAGLNERYVRDWLGALAAGGIVTADSDGHFYLPAEHAACLTRAAGAANMAVFGQYIGELGSVENDVVECFHKGGGVPYERFTRFHEIMAEDSGQSVLPAIETHILELAPDLRGKLDRGIKVLDAGCGRGKAITLLAERFPNSHFTGVDLSREATDWAREQAAAKGLANITFLQADLSHFERDAAPNHFDLVFTFDAVHDQAKPLSLLKGIHRALKRDGVYIMQDIHGHSDIYQNIDNPLGTLLYTVSCMHCMTVSLAQGGDGLGAMWGCEKAQDMLRTAGFSDIEIRRFDHDIQNDWYVVRK